MVVRMATGGYIRGGPFHSQCPETLYVHTPGLVRRLPVERRRREGPDQDRVPHRRPGHLLRAQGALPAGVLEVARARRRLPDPVRQGAASCSPGTDLTAITWGSGVVRCQRAAAELEKDGFSVEVIDLRTLVPLDEELIFASVAQDRARRSSCTRRSARAGSAARSPRASPSAASTRSTRPVAPRGRQGLLPALRAVARGGDPALPGRRHRRHEARWRGGEEGFDVETDDRPRA